MPTVMVRSWIRATSAATRHPPLEGDGQVDHDEDQEDDQARRALLAISLAPAGADQLGVDLVARDAERPWPALVRPARLSLGVSVSVWTWSGGRSLPQLGDLDLARGPDAVAARRAPAATVAAWPSGR